MAEKTCITCGKKFTTNHFKKITCSPECSRKHRLASRRIREAVSRKKKSPLEKTCIVCGKKFTTNHFKKITCSPECSRKHKLTSERIRSAMSRQKKPPLEKTCIICGKKFTTNHSKKITCSPECLAQRVKDLAKKHCAAKRKLPFERTCLHCGKKFAPVNGGQKYCCQACRVAAYEKVRPNRVFAPIKCKNCGTTIERPHRNQEFCSSECRRFYKNEKYNLLQIRSRSEVEDWVKLASEARVSYGKYRMYREKFGWPHEQICDYKQRNLI